MANRCLIAVAAPAEAKAVLGAFGADPAAADRPWVLHTPDEQDARFDLIVTGIGKANAAGAVGRFLDPGRHGWVLSAGIGGVLPGVDVGLGRSVLGIGAVFADEGLQTDDGFSDCAAMGFPLADFPGSVVPLDGRLVARLRPLADAEGIIATVSTCSGTDALARTVRERTGAIVEAMEGAAVGLVAYRLGVPAAELRVVSNTTGRRAGQRWDVRGALSALSDVVRRLRQLSE